MANVRYNKIICNDQWDYNTTGDIPDNLSLLIGTNIGLFLFKENKLIRLMNCHSYGITKYNDQYWYVYIKNKRFSKRQSVILCVRVDDDKLCSVSSKYNIKPGIHQIDFIDDSLWVSNTHNNSISVFNSHYRMELFPSGTIGKKRYESKNYRHFNSLFRFKDRVYVLAHNVFHYSKNKSQLYVLSTNGVLIDIIDFNGENCHNVYKDDERMLVCNSSYGSLLDLTSTEEKYLGMFTRGLSVFSHYIVVGGSSVEIDRVKRDGAMGAPGLIYILNRDTMSELGTISIDGAQIHEIRSMFYDEGMSNFINTRHK